MSSHTATQPPRHDFGRVTRQVTHINLQGPAWDDGFNPFYSSPTIATLAADAVDRG